MGDNPTNNSGILELSSKIVIKEGNNMLSVLRHIDLRQIRAFILVAKELQFRIAAERLHMTQPALSRTIRSLEEAIGTPLLTRTTRSVQLTEAGKVFLHECETALNHLIQAVEKARSAAQGDIGFLRIAYMDFAINGLLPKLIEKFHQQHPGIKIDLVYMPTSQQQEAILTDEIDFGFLIGPFNAQNVDQIHCTTEKMVALLPSNHRMANKRQIAMQDLKDEKFILGTEESWQTFRTHFFTLCHQAGFSPHISQEASTSNGIFGLVAANAGIAIYTSCAENIHRDGLLIRPVTKAQPLHTFACWRNDISRASKDKFLQFLLNNRESIFGRSDTRASV